MSPVLCRVLALLLPLLVSAATQASQVHFDLDMDLPPIIEDSTKPRQCTVAFLVEDTNTNDTFAARMQFTPASDAVATKGRLPCPSTVPPRLGERALDFCRERAANPRSCVFSDMSRGFENEPQARNTSEGASRCASDLSAYVGMACWNAGGFDVCNVACGLSSEEAVLAARNRCEGKHRKPCPISASLPVLAP